MRKSISSLAALALCALAGNALGQATDDCASSPVVGDGWYSWSLVGATNSVAGSCGGTSVAEDVFLQYVPTYTGVARASTCGNTSEDTVLAVYSDCAGTELACLDDFCGLQTQLDFPVTAGVPYFVRIASFGGGATGSGLIVVYDSSGPVPPPPGGGTPGDNCTDGPLVALDGTAAFTTVGATTDSAWSCAGGGADIHYAYTATSAGPVEFSTCGSGFDTAMMLGSSCGSGDYGCLDDGPCGLQQTMTRVVAVGEVVHITIGGYSGSTGDGTLTIGPPCIGPFTPPSGATIEPEVCDPNQGPNDTVNGGCNVTPEIYGSLACGETVRGTNWSTTSYRDTDWWMFTLPAEDTVTVTGQTQFNAQALLIDMNLGCAGLTVVGSAYPTACLTDFSMSVTLAAGTYVMWMGTAGFDGGTVCGTNSDYWFTMTFAAGCGGNPCDVADTNCDGSLNGFDVEATEQAVNGDFSNFCQPSADLNQDGAENGFDVEYSEYLTLNC
ncbi:hypothetical protein PHYC_00759 [Phycisphaerales bacterium]|nr:hypothetical protein PHYC_00759 [Phycisphaerales bacterium]